MMERILCEIQKFWSTANRPRTYIMAFDRRRYGENVNLLDNQLPYGNNLHLYDSLNDLLEFGAEAKYYMSSGYLETLEKHKESK